MICLNLDHRFNIPDNTVVQWFTNPIAGVLVLATSRASPSLSLAPGQSRKAKVGRCCYSTVYVLLS